MDEQEVRQRWSQCMDIIRRNTSEKDYKAWFCALQPIEIKDGELKLGVPSHFVIERIEADFLNLIRFAIQNAYGKSIRLEYRVLADKKNNITTDVEATKRTVFEDEKRLVQANEFINPNEKPIYRPLDPRLNPNYNFDNFIESECNKLSLSVAASISQKPGETAFNPMFIWGHPGVGKTHLANAIGIKVKQQFPNKRVLYVSAHEFQIQYTDSIRKNNFNNFINFYQTIDVLILDDVQEFATLDKTQDTFFHIFNYLHQNRKQLILTCDRKPADLKGMTDRLISRFKWGMVAEIARPDMNLRKGVIHSRMHRDGLIFPENVVDYLADNINDSVRDLEGAVTSLMARAAVFNRDPDIPMAEMLVHQIQNTNEKEISVEDIINKVCEFYKIDPKEIQTKSRKQKLVQIRQTAMFLSQKHTSASLSRIGSMIGNRNHATVLHAQKIVQEMLDTNKTFRKEVEDIEQSLR